MRAKSHDQRKGQWIINKIRTTKDFIKTYSEVAGNMAMNDAISLEKSMVEMRLWNMENDEFDKLMEDYNK